MRTLDSPGWHKSARSKGRTALAWAMGIIGVVAILTLSAWMQLRGTGESHFQRALDHLRVPAKPITRSTGCRSPVPGMAIAPERDLAGSPYFAGFWSFVKLPFVFRIDSPVSLMR